ncbi:DUF4097 family beta strand repeat-containing protein [Pyrinomonas methylaliphatogenes]|jgi:DUF4097 and DUF4098 domain-containing protein YvlB|uniref:DUF4097 domain-containing protein n=1 Tax=Pyrinomonas methylaliphatogenes TaxID=454194 RepID=A0A0B6WWD7_9BACT|nr:DUF4097 family beta strand repeat-containing protein [Pyrinomonas methylaliphatogenes]MBX5479826.1 DUF4097 family beta strand repeat protein [Pyrinomonas methylaliphatogenes]CDM65057.1 Domain of unknown function (DUF4098) [Pyrinomonas methylaliphatogenes]
MIRNPLIGLLLAILLLGVRCYAQRKGEAEMEVAGPVSVSLCVEQGSITVRGWERKAVRVESSDGAPVRLSRENGGGGTLKLEVLPPEAETKCHRWRDINLDVPHDATLDLRARNGDVKIDGVASVRARSFSGDIVAEHVAEALDVATLNGNISLSDIVGSAHVRTMSGSVEIRRARGHGVADGLFVKSTSGDVTLIDAEYSQIITEALSGSILFSGPIMKNGRYDLRTLSGDISLALPAEASFRLNARFLLKGEFSTDFDLRQKEGVGQQRLSAMHGTGEAFLNLVSLNGRIALRKR